MKLLLYLFKVTNLSLFMKSQNKIAIPNTKKSRNLKEMSNTTFFYKIKGF